jgi:hypothetical protein
MLLKQKILDAIAGGQISLVFRRWQRPSVSAGKTMKSAIGTLAIESVDIVEPSAITQEEARQAGYVSLQALLGSLGDGPVPLYRVHLHLAGPDPRHTLALTGEISDDERHALRRRLERHDRAGGGEPWTRAYLALIGAQPEVAAIKLAAQVGMEKDDFKRRVRKLKDMGLVTAHAVGYRLAPRGQAFLEGEAPLATE